MASALYLLLALVGLSATWFQIADSLQTHFDDVIGWEEPSELIELYPYFQSGHDADGCPVWIVNYGRWDFSNLMQKDEAAIKEFDKYSTLMFKRMYDSPKNASTPGNVVEQFIVIDDLEGYNNRQLIHKKTVKKQLELFQSFFILEKERGPGLKKGFGVNLNFPARSIWSLIKSQLGEFASKVEVFGTNANKWKMSLLKDIPAGGLPPWLGGLENFTSTQYFGKKKVHITKTKVEVVKN